MSSDTTKVLNSISKGLQIMIGLTELGLPLIAAYAETTAVQAAAAAEGRDVSEEEWLALRQRILDRSDRIQNA